MPNKAVVHKHGHYSLTASRLTSSAGSWSLNSSILDSVSWTMPSAMFTASTRSCQQHPLVQRNLEYPQQSAFGKSGPNGLHRTNIHITFLLLSSSAYLSAFLIIFSMSSLLRPPEDWITTGSHKVQREIHICRLAYRHSHKQAWADSRLTHKHMLCPSAYCYLLCCSRPVPLSLAETWTIPLASMSKVTSIWGTPRGAGGMPTCEHRSLGESSSLASSCTGGHISGHQCGHSAYQGELAQDLVVCRHLTLPLAHLDLHLGLPVGRRGEHLQEPNQGSE